MVIWQTGLPPFYDEDVNVMYQRILSDPLLFPHEMPLDAKSLITHLLQRDPTKRLGASGAEDIKRHPFFSKHIDWNRCVTLSIDVECCISYIEESCAHADEVLASFS